MNINFLHTLDQLSYKQIISIALFIAILLGLPIGVYLVSQQTRLGTRAAYQRPTKATEAKASPGPIPAQAPVIGRVFPWLGKTSDTIWIQGKNFGTNPTDKSLTVGGVLVDDGNIAAWEDTLIEAVIPEGALQGGSVDVRIGSYPVSRSLPTVLYDANAIVKLHNRDGVLTAEKASNIAKALIWTGDDEIPTQNHSVNVSPSNGETFIFRLEGLPLLSVLLLDNQGNIVPYYVDPVEFGF